MPHSKHEAPRAEPFSWENTSRMAITHEGYQSRKKDMIKFKGKNMQETVEWSDDQLSAVVEMLNDAYNAGMFDMFVAMKEDK